MVSKLLTLPDGRILSYGERGDPDGFPVMYFHGALGHRWEWPGVGADLRGIRWLSVERPGFGYSTAQPGRTLVGWAEDVRFWADRLGMERFHIAAWSTGCLHALACGHALGPRVSGMYLMNCPAPWLGSSGNGIKLLGPTWLARHTPRLFRVVIRMLTVSRAVFHAGVHVEIAVEQIALLRDRAFVRMLQNDHASALVQGPNGFVEDVALCGEGLTFSLRNARSPVVLWNGDRDGLVKPGTGRSLAERLPNARLMWARGATHFLPFTHEAYVLESLRRGLDQELDRRAG